MNYLFILRQAPYNSSLAREALDMVLATAAFDQKVRLLFTDEGVFQLVKQQAPSLIKQKNIEKTLQAFALYDINDIYFCESSAHTRGLDTSQLYDNAQALNIQACQDLLKQADKIISL